MLLVIAADVFVKVLIGQKELQKAKDRDKDRNKISTSVKLVLIDVEVKKNEGYCYNCNT